VDAGGAGGSDAPAATGGVGGGNGPTATGGAKITDGPVTTGGVGGSGTPSATGGTGAGGTAGTGATPAIVSFTVSPTAISAGESSTLSWSVSGATTLAIDQGIGSVLGKGSQVVAPTQTTTYTLTLNGSLSAQVTVAIKVAVLQGVFVPTGSLKVARSDHTATLLQNGQVLIVGGEVLISTATGYENTGLASAELYDPAAEAFTSTGSMSTGRMSHTATLLSSGKVLIAGGISDALTSFASAELYDPTTRRFTATGSMTVGREEHTATLLSDGRVLIVGGNDFAGNTETLLASAELYDPATETFTATGSTNVPTPTHTATLLGSGNVLVVGGMDGLFGASSVSEKLYDPATGTFSATGSMAAERMHHAASLLSSGEVLIVGGIHSNYGEPGVGFGLTSAELYDPATGTFSATGSMTTVRTPPTATLLNNGMVLVAGGAGLADTSAELYDPSAGTFAATGNMTIARNEHTATLLPSGKVLFVGADQGSTSAELYQ